VTEADETVFEASSEQLRDALVVRASGELDAFSIDGLAEQLESEETSVLLDLTGITYLSSAGVAALVLHTRRYAELGGRLCVVADQPAVLRPIALTGAEDAITVVPTLEDAD